MLPKYVYIQVHFEVNGVRVCGCFLLYHCQVVLQSFIFESIMKFVKLIVQLADANISSFLSNAENYFNLSCIKFKHATG